MKDKINKVGKLMTRFIDAKKVSPISAAVIVAVAVAILSLWVMPIIALAACVYFLLQHIKNKNDTIQRTDRAYEDAQNLESMKQLFTDVINFTCQSCDNSNLLKYALSVESFRTEKDIYMFRMEFPLDVFNSLEFGSWDDLKSEIQHGLDIFSSRSRYNIPPYAADNVRVIENTVRLYSLSRTDVNVCAELFLVNNSESYNLYRKESNRNE